MTWLRRNRWGLILLPVALLLAVAASSSRLVHFWLPYVASDVTTGGVGEKVHLSQEWLDRLGRHQRDVDVTITGVERTDVIRDWDGEDVPGEGPKGTTLWRVSMTLAAEPDQVLRGCVVEIEDTQGRRFQYDSMHVTPAELKLSACLNPDEEGPSFAFTDKDASPSPTTSTDASTSALDTERPRPPRWDTVADIILPSDAVPAKVRIWWDLPTVIDVPLTPTS